MNFDTEAMAIALHEWLVYREGGTPCWPGLSPERKTEMVAQAGALIARYMTRAEDRIMSPSTETKEGEK